MFLSRNYWLIVAPRKFDVLKTNIFPRRVANMLVLRAWREGAPANRATRGGLTSHTFLSKTHRGIYMPDRVARLPCLLARGTRLGGVAFCHVNGSSRAISANRGEINRENPAARSKYFRSYYLPMLSAEQNDSQSEEINVIDASRAESRPVFVQEAEI